jgi:hypothetical protein
MASVGFVFCLFSNILLITKNFLASLPVFSMGVGVPNPGGREIRTLSLVDGPDPPRCARPS